MRCLPVLWLLILAPFYSFAQQFGGNPPSLKWEQINTDTARIIFPKGLESQGERVAALVHYLNRNARKSIGNQEWKLSLVLQNQTTESNGYVAVAPFRSEFQITPSQQSFSLGSENWIDFLSIHEYRHALQNMNFRSGVSRVMYDVFGQEGFALATNASVPNWYWEGDAVFMETALTDQGRGRLPAFLNDFRGFMLEDKQYSFLKIRNGSLKDLVPDHYPLGYMLCAYGRETYGNTFWEKVTTDAVRYKSLFYPISRSLKHRTGENIRQFYQSAMSFYRKNWIADYDSSWKAPTTALTPINDRTVTDYEYPAFINPDTLVVLKTTYKKIPAFYLVDLQDHQVKLITQSIVNDSYFSYRNGKIAWIEYRTDPRWGWKDYGVIKVYDLRTRHTRTLSHRSKYFSPDISPDGGRVVVFEVTPGMDYSLKLLDARTGKLVRTLPNPEGYYYTYPKFTADGSAIISAVKNPQGEMGLIRQGIGDDSITVVVPFSHKVLGIPEISGDRIYFAASFGSIDNIYNVGAGGGQLFQVTGEPNGCYQPTVCPDGSRLVFSAYTIHGNQLRQMPLDTDGFRPVSSTEIQGINDLYVGKALQEEGSDILGHVPERPFPITRYHQTAGLINFHSIQPDFSDPDYSLDLLSNNILNTMDITAGYTYNRNEQSNEASVNATFAGLYPWINGGLGYTFDRNLITSQGGKIYWNEADYTAGLSIPLNFSSGKYYYSVTGGSSFYSSYIQYMPNPKYKLQDFALNYFDTYIGLTHQLIQANQNIFSHFAQSIYVQYNKTLSNIYAEQFYAIGDFYFPGFFVNHNLVLEGEFQQRDNQHQYDFQDNFIYARGYDPGVYSYITKFDGNYHFPVLYPDAGAAGIVYFLRIRGNIFYDYSFSNTLSTKGYLLNYYRSAGLEVYFDTKWWNEFPLSFGLRYSRLFDKDPQDPLRTHLVELVLPVQIF